MASSTKHKFENHFLNKLTQKKDEEALVGSVKENFDNIAVERNKIAEKIEVFVEKGFTKTNLLELIKNETFLPVSTVRGIIEEYYFNKDFSEKLSRTFNLSEIKMLKRIMKYKEFNTLPSQMHFLKENDIDYLLNSEIEKIEKSEKRFKHTFQFDEDGEILFTNLKECYEKENGEKISNGEFIKLALIEFYNSNPYDFEDKIKLQNLDF